MTASMDTSPTRGQTRRILLVEDNPGDVRLAREALRDDAGRIEIDVARDGEAALRFLQADGSDAPRPDLILLDLDLPRVDGREVLVEIKSDPDLRSIPVIVLTTSEADGDVEHAYAEHANGFVTKPEDLDRFVETMELLRAFWLDVARLPED